MNLRLNEVIISLTDRCNLRCSMCQIPLKDTAELSTEELKNLIIDIVDLHPGSIVFSGGEPLMRKDIFELISFANKNKINTCLTSNGTLITKEAAGRLASSGIGVVNISIEGPERVHDSLRGEGSFKKALSALENLASHRIEATIATVVCSKNYKSLAYVIELARKYQVTTVKFQPFSELFLVNKADKNSFFVSQSCFKDIETNIQKVITLSKKYKIATNPENYLKIIPYYLCGAWKNNSAAGCQALWSSCPISAEGDVHLCWVLYEPAIGNVRKERISAIWNSEAHGRLRKAVAEEKCSGCLMSCYDYNFGKEDLKRLILLKAGKLNKPRFYKRQYFRTYQYMKYILGKIKRRACGLLFDFESKKAKRDSCLINDIENAKGMLRQKMQALDKNG